MNSFNSKENKINHSESNFSKSINEVNKKLDEIIDSKHSSEINSKMKFDFFNFKINDNNAPSHICSEEKNQNNKDNNKEVNFQNIRLNFEKLMNSDMLAESYDILPSNEQYMNMNGNSSISIPYTESFEDNTLLKDESIFFVFDDNYKTKFVTEEDIKNIKKDEVELNFGEDPFEIYQHLSEEKNNSNDTSFGFYNSLSSFNIFKCKDPYYIKINDGNINENNFNNFYNYNSYYNNEKEMKYNDDYNTRENSRNSKIKRMAETIAADEKNYLLNNEIFFNNENEDEDEEIEEETKGGGIKKMDNNFINKKRKNQDNYK